MCFLIFCEVPFCLKCLSCSRFWLWDPMDCRPPGSSVHGILQTRRLVWVSISFCKESSQPRNWTLVLGIAGRFFTIWAKNCLAWRKYDKPSSPKLKKKLIPPDLELLKFRSILKVVALTSIGFLIHVKWSCTVLAVMN